MALQAPDNLVARKIREALQAVGMDGITLDVQLGQEMFLTSEEGTSKSVRLAPPFRIGDILDSAQKLLREASLPTEIKGAGWIFVTGTASFEKAGETPISLTEKERDLLVALWNARPGFLSREELLEKIWGYKTELETHTLETHIYRLRQKIERDPAAPGILLTEKVGYRLNLDD